MSAGIIKKVLPKPNETIMCCCHDCLACTLLIDTGCAMGYENVSRELFSQLLNLKSLLDNETP